MLSLGVSELDRTAIASAAAAELYTAPVLPENIINNMSRFIMRIEEELK